MTFDEFFKLRRTHRGDVERVPDGEKIVILFFYGFQGSEVMRKNEVPRQSHFVCEKNRL